MADQTAHITMSLSEIDVAGDEVPCCPICDMPIDFILLATIGFVKSDGFMGYCLVHTDCVERGNDENN